jgi:ubiquitin carboxyl-terminal hydrolase L3
LDPEKRAVALEESAPLEQAHSSAANQGDSAVPSLEDEVDFHYVCFAPSHKREGRLFELDGNRKGPIETPVTISDGDVLGPGGIGLVKDFIKREQGANQNFSLMALVAGDD